MDVIEAMRQRRSIRAFKANSVPRAVLAELIEIALRAPSWANTQPWDLYVVSGDKLERIKKAFLEKGKAGDKHTPEVPPPQEYPEPYNARRRAEGKQLLQALGISREDTTRRDQWRLRGQELFGAPCVIYMCLDRSFHLQPDGLNLWPVFDCGLLAQNIMLLAVNYGLGTIPEIQAVLYPDVIREILEIPETKIIFFGIAIGYPDMDHPANRFHSEREPLEKVTSWVGFD